MLIGLEHKKRKFLNLKALCLQNTMKKSESLIICICIDYSFYNSCLKSILALKKL